MNSAPFELDAQPLDSLTPILLSYHRALGMSGSPFSEAGTLVAQSRSKRRWSTRWCGVAHPLPAALRSPRTGPRHASEVGSVVTSGDSARNVRRAKVTVTRTWARSARRPRARPRRDALQSGPATGVACRRKRHHHDPRHSASSGVSAPRTTRLGAERRFNTAQRTGSRAPRQRPYFMMVGQGGTPGTPPCLPVPASHHRSSESCRYCPARHLGQSGVASGNSPHGLELPQPAR